MWNKPVQAEVRQHRAESGGMYMTTNKPQSAKDIEFIGEVIRLLNAKDPTLGASVSLPEDEEALYGISIDLPDIGRNLLWANGRGKWGCEINDLNGDFLDEMWPTHVSSDSEDAQTVADFIYDVTRRYPGYYEAVRRIYQL